MKQTRMKLLVPEGTNPAGRNIVFISYRHNDAVHAAAVIDLLLKETDFAIWYDDNLAVGEKFDDEIRDALDSSIAMIQVVTPSYFERGSYTVEQEIPYARSIGLKIAAICMDASALLSAEIVKRKPDHVCSFDDPDSVSAFLSALRVMDRETGPEEQALRSLKKRNRAFATPEDMFLLAQLFLRGKTDAFGCDEAIRFASMAALCGMDGAEDLLRQLEGKK